MAGNGPPALLVDRRTGTTTTALCAPDARPATKDGRPAAEETHDVDDWLTVISSGRCVGVTAEATAHQYQLLTALYRGDWARPWRRAGRALSTSRGS